jgi:molybdopterin molybdotransferase
MGRPKLDLPFDGESLLQRVIRILSSVVDPVVVVAAASQVLPELPPQIRIARDGQPDLGPLSGLAAGLSALSSDCDAAFATACDTPLLSPEFVKRMQHELGACDMVVCREADFYHPLAAVYRTRLAKAAHALVQDGRLRPGHLIQQCAAHVIDVEELRAVDPELESLKNLNTPEEYEAALRAWELKKARAIGVSPPSQHRDVRMRGFATRTSVDAAVQWIDTQAATWTRAHASVDLRSAPGRTLSGDIQAALDVPDFDRAAMDGFAVRGRDTDGAGDYQPLTLKVVGEAFPGRPCLAEIEERQAVRIMTGAPIPTGANAVIPAEFCTDHGTQVDITASVPTGKHVGQRGEDICAGTTVLSDRRYLRPQDIGLLSALGYAKVPVVSQPRVQILATGDEIVPAGSDRGPHQIFDANTPMLEALVTRDGGRILPSQRIPDSSQQLRACLNDNSADVVLVSGGSSVGTEDHAPNIVAELGELAIHGVAMRPASPAGMGRIGNRLVFLLPGNPVSCLCAYDFFAGRAIRQLGGAGADWPYMRHTLPLAEKIASAIGRVDYCRIAIREHRVFPLAISGASILSSTTRADGFVIVPAESEGLAAGETVVVFRFDFPG